MMINNRIFKALTSTNEANSSIKPGQDIAYRIQYTQEIIYSMQLLKIKHYTRVIEQEDLYHYLRFI